jgi:nucleoside-diphosphate-sugar epimerase
MINKICVTGAYGFIGNSICKALVNSNRTVRAIVRTLNPSLNYKNIEYISLENVKSETDYKNLLLGYDCIIHCAGKVPEVNKVDDVKSYNEINIKNTKLYADLAVKSGVKRLIFLSSASVYGGNNDYNIFQENKKNKIFNYGDLPNPISSYAKSKLTAEKLLWGISKRTGLEVVVVRLPLVYGKGVKGNLRRLIKLINLRIPLPLGLVNNRRSLIGIDNLVDALIRCVDCPQAAGETFLVSDGEDLSTPKILKNFALALNCPIRLFPFPVRIIVFFCYIINRRIEVNKLIGSLQIDNNYICEKLNWTPPVSVMEGIKRMFNNK